ETPPAALSHPAPEACGAQKDIGSTAPSTPWCAAPPERHGGETHYCPECAPSSTPEPPCRRTTWVERGNQRLQRIQRLICCIAVSKQLKISYLYVRTAGNSSGWAMSSCSKMPCDQPATFLPQGRHSRHSVAMKYQPSLSKTLRTVLYHPVPISLPSQAGQRKWYAHVL